MRLGPILYGTRLDDAARLEDLEVELLEKRQLRREGAEQQHHREQRDQKEHRTEEVAADERDEDGRHDPGLVDLERRMVDGGEGHYFSMGTRIELPHSVHDPS